MRIRSYSAILGVVGLFICTGLISDDASAQIKAAPTPAPTPTPVTPVKPLPIPISPIPVVPGLVSPLFQAKLNNGPTTLRGFVDLHTHPMAQFAMGGKLLHGAPDVGILMPAGSIWNAAGQGMSGATCNGANEPARNVEQALGTCYSSHSGHDLFKNKCGDEIRKKIIDEFENGKRTNKPHSGDDHPPGYPAFTKWPKYNDIIHQQMWIDWIKRAKDGGLRVMVALTVNSMTLAKGLNGNQPYDDKTVGNLQTQEMKKLVEKNKAWMDIADNAADLRKIVGQDKLAIILGSEVDDIGNFAWSKKEPSRAEVKAEIDRLYRDGIRYIFPVHVIDNWFGGTAIYEGEFPRASKYHFGQWPTMTCATQADGITARFTHGWDAFKSIVLGDAGGNIPVPQNCANSPFRMGWKNARGLTPLGAFAIDEMMAKGMIIDIDHGSQNTVNAILSQAASKPGGYPVVSGHNGLRDNNPTRNNDIHENSRTAQQYKDIAARGGVAGIGFGDSNAKDWIKEVREVLAAAPNLPINLGSDINGFVVMPKAENCGTDRCVKYDASFPMAKWERPGSTKTWNYNTDSVAHIGLFPDFLRHVENEGGKDIVNKLFDGAEGVADMWERAESVGRKVKDAQPTTFNNITAIVRVTDDDVRGGARAWITIELKSGKLPEVEVTALVTKGGNTANTTTIRMPAATKPEDVVAVHVRHFSNDCFACSRDYWNGNVELEGDNGAKIMKTKDFRIGHETQSFKR
jgi:microsomal dipeptidase-like Zn-dependent dipeptidase